MDDARVNPGNYVALNLAHDKIHGMRSGNSVLERLLLPSVGDMPPEYAQRILSVDFGPEEIARHQALAEKSGLGTLSHSEQLELHDLVTINDLLTILHAKAQLSIQKASAA